MELQPLQERAVREAYLTLYGYAGASKEDHFIFTSSGAEAVNHAIFAAYVDITRKTGKNHFLCSSLDEAPAIMAMGRLQELGCVFQMVPASKSGFVTLQAIAEMITPRTAMLSLSAANALTGTVQPLEGIADLCRERGIFLHVDATYVLAKREFSFADCGADVMTFGAPFGAMGGMFIRKNVAISPLILGGKEQGNLRSGPFSVSALIECAKWAKEERANGDHYGIEIARLRALFEEIVCARANAEVLFQNQERVPHITSFLFPGIASDALCYTLAQKGVKSTFGGNHLQHFVHILKACGIEEPLCHTALSFAFSHETTEEEIQNKAEAVVDTVNTMQNYSAHLMNEVT